MMTRPAEGRIYRTRQRPRFGTPTNASEGATPGSQNDRAEKDATHVRSGSCHLRCCRQRFEYELNCRRLVPADAEPAVGVRDDGDVRRALPGRELREIGDPQAVGCVDGEVALNEIRGERCRYLGGRPS